LIVFFVLRAWTFANFHGAGDWERPQRQERGARHRFAVPGPSPPCLPASGAARLNGQAFRCTGCAFGRRVSCYCTLAVPRGRHSSREKGPPVPAAHRQIPGVSSAKGGHRIATARPLVFSGPPFPSCSSALRTASKLALRLSLYRTRGKWRIEAAFRGRADDGFWLLSFGRPIHHPREPVLCPPATTNPRRHPPRGVPDGCFLHTTAMYLGQGGARSVMSFIEKLPVLRPGCSQAGRGRGGVTSRLLFRRD